MMPQRFNYASERRGRRGDERAGIRIKKLGSLAGYRVYAVDGYKVRNEVDIDFTQGGNGCRYGYVPWGEIWVDSCLHAGDVWPTVLHEIIEDVLMRSGYEYDAAHDEASKYEVDFRDSGESGLDAVKAFIKKLDLQSRT